MRFVFKLLHYCMLNVDNNTKYLIKSHNISCHIVLQPDIFQINLLYTHRHFPVTKYIFCLRVFSYIMLIIKGTFKYPVQTIYKNIITPPANSF